MYGPPKDIYMLKTQTHSHIEYKCHYTLLLLDVVVLVFNYNQGEMGVLFIYNCTDATKRILPKDFVIKTSYIIHKKYKAVFLKKSLATLPKL